MVKVLIGSKTGSAANWNEVTQNSGLEKTTQSPIIPKNNS